MSGTFAEALADADQPDEIEQILKAPCTDSPSVESGSEQQRLEKLYDRFLSRREQRSPETRSQYKRTIPKFIQFADTNDVEGPHQINTELVDRYVDELKASYETDATVYTHTKNIRTWFNWMNDRQLCDESVIKILSKDELGLSPAARDEALPEPVATEILNRLRNRQFGTDIHAALELFWNTGVRLGGGQSLDLDDFYPDKNELWLEHRPETETRLKNGDDRDDTPGDGERVIQLSDEVVDALQQYIDTERPAVSDAYGRQPLFTTTRGRASKSTLRRWLYEATSCRWQSDDDTKPNCDGNCDPDSHICPQSYYPHAIRRGSIVNHLSGGLRPDLASQRFDVSVAVIKKHYDPRTKRERKQVRKEAVRASWSD
jgi:site-specific recombinase XerD